MFRICGPPEADVAGGGVKETQKREHRWSKAQGVVLIKLALGVVQRVGEIGIYGIQDINPERRELEAEGE